MNKKCCDCGKEFEDMLGNERCLECIKVKYKDVAREEDYKVITPWCRAKKHADCRHEDITGAEMTCTCDCHMLYASTKK